MGQKVLNKRSVQVVNNGPKLPTPEQLEYGELAINYADGHETLAIKNNQNEIVPFSCDETIYSNVQTQIDTTLVSVSSAITALSGSVSAFSASVISTYATSANTHSAIAAASGNVYKSATAYSNTVSGNIEKNFKKYATSANVHNTITAVGTRIDNLNTSLMGLSGSVSAFSASIISTYATSADTHNAISTASGNVYKSATAYTKQVSGYIEQNFKKYPTSAQTHDTIAAVGTRVDNLNTSLMGLSGSVSAFSASVISTYATSANTHNAISTASGNVYKSATAYTKQVSGYIEQNFKKYPSSAQTHNTIAAVGTRVDNLNTTLMGLSGSVSAFSASVVSLEDDLIDRIESALTVVYKFKGTVTNYSDLSSITSPKNGDVYNVVNAQGTIGQPGYTPPGTNYAWNETGNTWDALGGSIDLSNYVTQAELSAATATTDNVMRAVYYVSGAVSAFSASVISKYATSANTHSAIAAASGNVYNTATAYTKTVSGNIEQNFKKYATSANTHSTFTAVGTRIDNLSSDLNALSGAVSAFNATMIGDFATKAEASEYAAAALANAMDYTDSVSGNIEQNFGKYATSAQTHGAVTALGTRIDNVNTTINGLSGSVSAFSASVISKYATSANTHNAISTASGNVYKSATAYTNTVSGNIEKNFNKYATSANTHAKIESVKSELNNRIDGVSTDVSNLSGSVIAFSGVVRNNYSTKAEASQYAAAAYANAMNYTDSVSGNIEQNFKKYPTSAQTHGAIIALGTRIDNVNTTINGLSGSVSAFSASVVSLEGDLIDRIESALTIVYKYKGTVTSISQLLSITNASNGDVYNLTVASGDTPPGTNYAWNETENTWDALGGSVDLSNYVTQSQLSAATATTDNVMRAVYYVSGAVSAFSASVISKYATSANTHSAISTASGNVYNTATAYTKTVSGNIEKNFGKYATSANTHNTFTAVGTRIDNLSSDLNALSGAVSAFNASIIGDFATKAEASEYAAAALANSVSYTDSVSGNIELNFKKYATSAQTHGAITALGTRVDNANTAINGLSGSVSAFSAYVAYNYATKAEASEYASTAYSNAIDYTDVVSGYIRTTLTGSYVTSAITHTAIKAVDSRVDGAIREIGYVSGGLYTFSASVVSKYATSANTHSAIAAASGNVYKSATAYTNTVSGNIEQNFKKYATSANTHNAISSTNTRIDNLTQEIIDNEFVTAHALNDLNDRLEDLFLTVVDLSTFADDFSFPRITEEDNGKILQVVNGKLTLVTPTSIYTGTGQPNNLLGNNGDIYIQTS